MSLNWQEALPEVSCFIYLERRGGSTLLYLLREGKGSCFFICLEEGKEQVLCTQTISYTHVDNIRDVNIMLFVIKPKWFCFDLKTKKMSFCFLFYNWFYQFFKWSEKKKSHKICFRKKSLHRKLLFIIFVKAASKKPSMQILRNKGHGGKPY